jgi:hypothetical protein
LTNTQLALQRDRAPRTWKVETFQPGNRTVRMQVSILSVHSQGVRMSRTFTAPICLAVAISSVSHAQLMTSWSAPSVDDGKPIPNFVATWESDTTTGQVRDLPAIVASRALAADNELGRLYASAGSSISSFRVDGAGNFVPVTAPIAIRDAGGAQARSGQVDSLGVANGVLFASVLRTASDEQRRRGIPRGFYTINASTGVATLVAAASSLPLLKGMDFNPEDGFMYAVVGNNNAQSIVRFDLTSFVLTTVAAIPASAYAGQTGLSFDGVAVGEGRVYLTTGLNSSYGNVPIAVFNIASNTFEPSLPSPQRTAENRFYGAGATFFQPLSATGAVSTFAESIVGSANSGAAAQEAASAEVSEIK